MSDIRGLHGSHDLEFVARAAAGDLAADEAGAARALFATCEACATLAADLRAIAQATRDLGSAASRAPSIAAPRDFRLTEADAARLRRRGVQGAGGGFAWLGGRVRGLGGALATLGLVGLLVAAGLPAFSGGAASGPTSEEPRSGVSRDTAGPVAATGPGATNAREFAASSVPTRMVDTPRDESASPPTSSAVLAVASLALLLGGLGLLAGGRARHRPGRDGT